MVTTPRDNTFPITVVSSLGKHTLYQIKQYRPWIINLNEKLSEPIVSITFSDKSLECAALLDSGASVNCIGYRHFKMVQPDNAPDPINIKCLGPDGNPIECAGKTQLTFSLGTQQYREEFFVLSRRSELVCILSYPFMCKNGIRIVPHQYVTNTISPSPVKISYISREIGQLQVKPYRDCDIPPHSVSRIALKLLNTPPGIQDHIFNQWAVCVPGQHVQVATLSHNQILEVLVTNNTQMYKPISTEDFSFGSATPYVEFLHSQNNPSVERISASDIISNTRMSNGDITMSEDGVSETGDVIPGPIIPKSNQDSIITTGADISIDSIPMEPCNFCRSQGERTYCKFELGCLNLNNPFISSFAPSRIEVVKEIKNENVTNIEYHPIQHIMDWFSRKKSEGCMIWCLRNSHPWFLPKNSVYPGRDQLIFHSISGRKAGVVTKHYEDRKSAIFNQQDQLFAQKINDLINCHAISTVYLTCECLYNFAAKEMIHAKFIICPGNSCQTHSSNVFVNTATCQEYVASDEVSDNATIVTSDEQAISRYQEIIKSNEQLFSTHPWDIGTFCDPVTKEPYIFEYKLRPGSIPYVAKFRPISPMKVKPAQEMIQCLLENHVITRRICPWVANSVWALKSRPILTKQQARDRNVPWIGQVDELAPVSLRLTVSYVKLNTCVEFVPTPLPNIRKLFRQMENSSVLSIIDLTWSYYSLKISDLSACLTGFYSGIPSDFTLAWTRSPMGISPSSGFLQAAVTFALSPVKEHTINYSDNILVHSSPERHADVLAETLSLLKSHGFKIKKNKMAIAITKQIKVLGCVYNVSEKTLSPDPSKTEALSQLPYPTSISKLKHFLGAYQFMISAMHDSAQYLATLYKLTRGKNTTFEFDDDARKAFDNLKKIALHPSNFIYFINYDLPIVLRVDSSTDAVGYTLLQFIPERKRFVSCGYGVKVFTQIQARYSASERELLGAVVALKSCEDIISGSRVIVQLDCRGIILLTATAQTNSKISRYLSYLNSFTPALEFSWIAGRDKLFTVSDMLSRSVADDKLHLLTNKNINPKVEESIDKIASKFSPGTSTINDFPIILDYILSRKEHAQHVPGFIFINPRNDICVYKNEDGPCVSILMRHGTCPRQVSIPLTMKELELMTSRNDEDGIDNAITSPVPRSYSSPALEDVINTVSCVPDHNALLSDVSGQGVSSTFQSELDVTDIKHRFLKFVITKFPLLDMSQLQELQSKDTHFQQIIEKCKLSQNLQWVKKNGVSFHLIKNILIRICERPIINDSYQLCLPKVSIVDQLIFIHRSILKSHLGVKRLVQEFSEIFFNPHTETYAKMVVDNCYVCSADRPRHKNTRPDYSHRILVTIEQPGTFWYSDTIQIVSKKTSNMNSLLTFADGFSAYVVAVPYCDPMTNQKFLEIFELHVLTTFPQTRYVLSDNAQNISSAIVKQYLHNLNIQMLNSRPYSSKSNIAEGLQRLLLRSIKLGIQETAIQPHDWHKILPPAIISLNCTPYYGLRFNLCPHTVQFGSKPNLTSLFCLNPDLLHGAGYDAYVVKLAKMKFLSTKIMCQYNRQKSINNSKTQKGKLSPVLPGDIVFRVDRTRLQKTNYKMRPRSSELFLVLLTTRSSAFCRAYSGQNVADEMKTFQQFLNSPKSGKNALASFSLQHFDICDLIKVRTLITCSTNSKFLASELDKVEFPGSFTIEVDSIEEDSIPLTYDVDTSDSESSQNEDLNILDPSLCKPIRSLLRNKKEVHFCPQAVWHDLNGDKQNRPLTNKYTLTYSILGKSFSPCI